MIMGSSILGSWILQLCGQDDAAEALSWIASLATIPMIYRHWTENKKGLLVRFCLPFFVFEGSLASLEFRLMVFQTIEVTKNSFKGFLACWKNRHFETVRPLKNVFVHSINLVHSFNQLVNHVFLVEQRRNQEWEQWQERWQKHDQRRNQEWEQWQEQWRKRDKEWENSWRKFNSGNGREYNNRGTGRGFKRQNTDDWYAPCAPTDTACMKEAGSNLTNRDLSLSVKIPKANQVLGLKNGYTDKACKDAYRSLAMTYHPDKCALDQKPVCNEVFPILANAYEILNFCKA
jgi:hypothetical protein